MKWELELTGWKATAFVWAAALVLLMIIGGGIAFWARALR